MEDNAFAAFSFSAPAPPTSWNRTEKTVKVCALAPGSNLRLRLIQVLDLTKTLKAAKKSVNFRMPDYNGLEGFRSLGLHTGLPNSGSWLSVLGGESFVLVY